MLADVFLPCSYGTFLLAVLQIELLVQLGREVKITFLPRLGLSRGQCGQFGQFPDHEFQQFPILGA